MAPRPVNRPGSRVPAGIVGQAVRARRAPGSGLRGVEPALAEWGIPVVREGIRR